LLIGKKRAFPLRVFRGLNYWVLLLIVTASGASAQPQPAEPQAVANPATPKDPAASAGFVNDWLRSQSPTWEAFDIGGQFRSRFEHREHMAIPGQPGAIDFRERGAVHGNSYWLFRTRAHLGFRPADWFGLYVEGRDSFSLNDRRDPDPESDRLDLHQAYLSIGDPGRFPIIAKVGRQELVYGDERLIGAFEWNNIGRVFDAAKLRYEQPEFWVDGFAGRVVVPRDGHFNEVNDYDWFWGVYGSSRELVPWQETQVYFLGRNASGKSPAAARGALIGLATPRDIYTVGGRVKSLPGKLQGWDYSAEAAAQFGRFKESAIGPSLDHEAFAAHVGGGYTFAGVSFTPRLGVEYNFASGDSDPADDRHETFENLFPTNHKFYGYMDFFSWQNIHNVRASASIKPLKSLTLTLDYHLFWLAETADYFYTAGGAPRSTAAPGSGMGYNRNPGYDNFVGSEINLIASYNVKKWANLQGGYGHFFVGNYVKESLASPNFGAADADWVYVQIAINF
jgi:hypothetical protein